MSKSGDETRVVDDLARARGGSDDSPEEGREPAEAGSGERGVEVEDVVEMLHELREVQRLQRGEDD